MSQPVKALKTSFTPAKKTGVVNFDDLMPSGKKITKFNKKPEGGTTGQEDHSNKKDWKNKEAGGSFSRDNKFGKSGGQAQGFNKTTGKPWEKNVGGPGTNNPSGCFKCGLDGHLAKECPTSKRWLGKRPPTQTQAVSSDFPTKNTKRFDPKDKKYPTTHGKFVQKDNRRPVGDGSTPHVNHWDIEKSEKTALYALASKVSGKGGDNDEKIASIDEVLNLIGEDFEKFVEKKAGSRLIQSCLKNGNRAQKDIIFKRLMKGDTEEVLKSKYGQFIMKKVVLYNNNSESRKGIQTFVDGSFWTLIWNENGCRAIHDYLENLSDLKRLQYLEEKFSDENTEEGKNLSEAKKLHFIKKQVLEGKLYHYSPVQYWLFHNWDTFEGETLEKLTEELQDSLEFLVGSSKNCGIWLYSKIFDSRPLKDQKKMLKTNTKDKLMHLCTMNTNVTFFIIKVLFTFDDSKTLSETLLSQIKDNFMTLLATKETLSMMLYIVNGDFDREFFSKAVNRITQPIRDFIVTNSGKKPSEAKLTEARNSLFNQEMILGLFEDNFKENCFGNSQFCVFIGLLLQRLITDKNYDEAVTKFVDLLITDTCAALVEAEDSEYGALNKSAFVTNAYTHRMVKKFIQGFTNVADAGIKLDLEGKIKKFVKVMVSNLGVLIKTRSVFVLIGLIENTSYAKSIKKALKNLEGFAEMCEGTNNKGLELLAELVNK